MRTFKISRLPATFLCLLFSFFFQSDWQKDSQIWGLRFRCKKQVISYFKVSLGTRERVRKPQKQESQQMGGDEGNKGLKPILGTEQHTIKEQCCRVTCVPPKCECDGIWGWVLGKVMRVR